MSNTNSNTAKTCPITREEFLDGAQTITLSIGGRTLLLNPREFSTGSFGWNANEKLMVEVDGVECPCQVGFNLTVVNSKLAK